MSEAVIAQLRERSRRDVIAPRFIRAGAAPAYLGMCRDEFNKTVRPNISEFPIGQRGIGFDREELDAWADEYVEQSAIDKSGVKGQQSACSERHKGESTWREKTSPASRKGRVSGISTRKFVENDFTKALELVTGRKPSAT